MVTSRLYAQCMSLSCSEVTASTGLFAIQVIKQVIRHAVSCELFLDVGCFWRQSEPGLVLLYCYRNADSRHTCSHTAATIAA